MTRTNGPGPGAVRRARDETERVAGAHRRQLLDAARDTAFSRVAALAARLLDARLAAVTITGADRVWLGTPDGLLGTGDAVTGAPGMRAFASAPIMTAGGRRLGSVTVLDTRPRTVTGRDHGVLADLAAIVLDELKLRSSGRWAVRAEHRRAEVEHAARARAERDRAAIAAFAATLQQTLLPSALPAVPGLELACHYHPASPRDVGGDFYDVFRLGARRWGLFLGDVCGKGAPAAALTSLARCTLRAAACHSPGDPVAVLTALNDSLLAEPSAGGRFCTVLYGVLDVAADGMVAVTLAGGGHPPACHLTPGRGGARNRLVELAGSTLVGVLGDPRFVTSTVRLSPGSGLLLYTDGLTEARTSDGELLGQDGVVAFLDSTRSSGPVSASGVIAGLAALLGRLDGGVRDDVAMLALSVPPG